MKRSTLFFLCGSIGLYWGCSTTNSAPKQNEENPTGTYEKGFFVINEGNFGWGEGSVSFINPTTKKVYQDIYKTANQNKPLGNVAQSMAIFEGKGFVVVNNSKKIEVVNPKTFASLGVIEGFNSPRYFLGIHAEKAYVTDLYEGCIWIVNPSKNTITGKIALPSNNWTEEMLKVGSTVWVENLSQRSLLIIDTHTDKIIHQLNLEGTPRGLQMDAEGNIWTLAASAKANKILRFNPNSHQIEAETVLNDSIQSPHRLKISADKKTLYFIGEGIYTMNTSSLLPKQIISGKKRNFYGLGIAPQGDIYVSDAIDYVQKGYVFRYDSRSFAQLDSFKVGVIPFYFCFDLL